MNIYQPAEDSYLLLKILEDNLPELIKQNPNLKFLEIGAGTGINLQTALEFGIKKENIFSCDINPEAVEHCSKLGFNCINSNLFEKIKGKFDLIIFNPPYLPSSKFDNGKDTTGGKKGDEIIVRFLKELRIYLSKNGKALLLFSSLTPRINIDKELSNYKKIFLEKKKLFFEEIYVLELKAR